MNKKCMETNERKWWCISSHPPTYTMNDKDDDVNVLGKATGGGVCRKNGAKNPGKYVLEKQKSGAMEEWGRQLY